MGVYNLSLVWMYSWNGINQGSFRIVLEGGDILAKNFFFQMKKELDAFDPNFFEELEDLKYNYQEAVKRNVQYEEQLNSLAKQYGFPLDT